MIYQPYTVLDFEEIDEVAEEFAIYIKKNLKRITRILNEYESLEVVLDETNRTLDLLKSLSENRNYFRLRIGEVTAFLPRNQPLYALACYVIVPSLMASQVHFRIPHTMRGFYPKLLDTLKIKDYFPNVFSSVKERLEFLIERSALRINPETRNTLPLTEAVVFTGVPYQAERLRRVFDSRTLFILNGAGHNPVVVAKDADIPKAIEAVLSLQFYNEGQDCAAPNAILVHKEAYQQFLYGLLDRIERVKIGPISESRDLVRIQKLLIDNKEWIEMATPGVINTKKSLVQPVVINKPLEKGGNFEELFSPIVFLQMYNTDADLNRYFEDPQYSRNAMYVTVYGRSEYIGRLVGKMVSGRVLHKSESVLYNTHLHAPGVERGTKPYGGSGYGASSLSMNRKVICRPTLPQRDIYELVAKPVLDAGDVEYKRRVLKESTDIVVKNVSKLLGLSKAPEVKTNGNFKLGTGYVDTQKISKAGRRYVGVSGEEMYVLLDGVNIDYVVSMPPDAVTRMRQLLDYLKNTSKLNANEISDRLYILGGRARTAFFRHIYQLLFGKNSGPRLGQFLVEADKKKICELLDV